MSRARDMANLGAQAGSGLDASDITTGTLGNTVQDNITRLGAVTQGSIGSAVTGYTGARMVDFWKVDSNQGAANGTIINEFSRVSNGSQQIGSTGMTKHSTDGIFTFPDTGKYIIHQFSTFKQTGSGGEQYCALHLQVTLNNSSYNDYTNAYDAGPNTNYYGHSSSFYFLDVTDLTNVKCRFKRITSNTSVELLGHASIVFSGILFIRIGDT